MNGKLLNNLIDYLIGNSDVEISISQLELRLPGYISTSRWRYKYRSLERQKVKCKIEKKLVSFLHLMNLVEKKTKNNKI